ncbi:MAG: hypothetical protein KDI28_11990 [Pseudomonadales bacterium]|nr:hypothetical protein [Pseudomonadales bacterium]
MRNSSAEKTPWVRQQLVNRNRLAAWTAAYVLTMALASFGPVFLWDGAVAGSVLAIGLNTCVGAGMIWANIRNLLGLDEMQQRLQLEAMGISLGVGLVAGLSYENLDISNVIVSHAQISWLVMLMGVTYLATTLLRARAYQ